MENRHTLRLCRFTLMELLVVIGLIMFIAGMSFTVATAVSTGKGPEGGARMISRMLELTRQLAISENRRAALLMPTVGDTLFTSDDTNQSLKKLHPGGDLSGSRGIVVRPCIIDRSNQFVRWVDNTEWVVFPERVHFEPGTNMATKVTSIHFDGKTNLESTAIRFKPNGSLVDVNNIENIYITKMTDKVGEFKRVYKLSVNWLTGKVTIEKEP